MFALRHVQCWRWGLALCVALGMMLFWQPLTARSMAADAVSIHDLGISRASDWPAPLAQEATPPTLSGLYPPRNAITAALATTITARYNQPMTATSVTSRTFVVHGMQSGVVTQVHGLADAYTLAVTPTRAFHQGELVYVIAATGTANITGTHPLSGTQWQFNAGVVTPRCVSGFSDIAAGLTGARFSHVAWGDYDADGDLDFLLTGWGASGMVSQIYQNTGAGFSQVYPGSLPGVSYSSAAWGDYDADGDLDILLTGYTGGYIARIYQNTGLGFSQVYTGSLPGVYRSSVAWGDYDNDGDLDILLAGDTGSGYISRVYQNTGAGFNQVYAGSLPGVSWSSVAWGDYDNDGDLDILLTGNTGSGTLSRIYQNTGAGFSHDSSVNLPGMSMGTAAWGDYDNDGDLDILLGGGVAQVYQNTGAAFSPVYTGSLTATALGNAAWGDYDNDGDLDILLTGENQSNFNATTQIYGNTGAGFSPVHSGSLLAVEMSSAAWGDYDNDGDLDVLLVGDNNDSLFARVYRNEDCIADLALTKSVTPAVATPGTTLTYTLAFTNGGFGPALGVIITDTLPVSVTHVSVSSNVAITDTGFRPAYVWQVQNLTSGQSGRITIIGVLRNVLPAGVFTNTATIATTGAEAYLDDNEGRASLTVINTAPILEAIGDQTVDELTLLTFTATATDTDIPAQPLTFTLGSGSVGAITPGGVFTWTPTEAQGPGVYMATIQVSDGAQVDSETVSITVREVSQPPTLWPIGGQSVAAGMPVRFVTHATDPDLPTQPLTYTLDAGSVGSIAARTGHFTWTASATPGVYTATVRVTDGDLAAAETVAITVTEDTPGIGQWVLAANGSFGDWPFASASNLRIVDTTDDAVYGPFLDGRLGSNSGQRVDVAVTPDGKTALISNFGDATVFLIDVTHPLSPSLITSVTLPFFAEDIAISPDGRYALVADGGWSAQLATIDIPAATLVYTADLGTAAAQGVAIAPDGTVIFPNYYGSSIHTLVLEETGVLTYAAGMTQTNTYTYTYPDIPPTDSAYYIRPLNVGIAPDGQTVIVCDAATSTVGIYQIVAPGVLTFTGLVAGAHGTPYEFYDSGGGDLVYPGVQSVAFNAAGDKAYLSINHLITNDITGTNTGDRVGVLAITGPGQVHLEAGGVVTVPHQTNGQFLGVDTLVIAGHKAYVGYPTTTGTVDPTTLAVVDLTDESVTTTMVFTTDTHIPAGVAAIPQRRLDLHQTVSDPAPLPGDLITYTLTLRGTGPEISEITLLDTLPPEVDFVGPIAVFPPTAGIAGSAPPTLATHLVVSPTQPVTVTFPVRVRLLPPGTPVTHTARAESFLLSTPASAPRAFTIGCAPTITVQTLDDSGAGSLRWAIAGVCDGGTVDFAAGLAGQSIILTSETLTLTRPVSIANPHAPGLRLSGNNAMRVFYVPPAVTVTLSSLHIISGTTSSDPMIGYGGGIYNRGTLTVQDCTVSGNTAFFGGGIANGDMGGGVDGTLTLLNSIVAHNTATSAGGIWSYGTLLVQNSVISGNVSGGDSGGLCLYSGQATVHHSAVADNIAEGWGGGIWSGVPLTITDSTISGNTALAGGGLQILAIDGTYITNTTISGNRAKQNGGGIGTRWNSPEIYLSHSTVVSNTADYDGGDDGQGGGLYVYQRAYFLLTHTLVAGNLDMGGQTPECAVVMPEAGRGIYSGGYNLIGDTTGCSLTTHSTDLLNQAALFDALADNGNDTQTHALLPGSPAIDAIPTLSCTLAADQRGIARPQGSGCDIGAFESRGFSLTRGGGDQSALVHTAFAAPLLVTVTSAFTEPVDGGRVVFTAPATGASVTFTQSITQTIHNGAASVAATANDHVGAYTVTASTSGAPDVDFTLTNVGYTLTTTITGTGGGSVAVNPEGDYDYGAVIAVTATPLISSTFTGWSGDCSGVGACAVVMTQTRAVTATFAIKHYVLTPTAGTGGAITPSTPQTVTYGSDLAFAITPETGYHITDVLVDGVSVGARNGYTFTAITADHTLAATFALNTYVITPTAGTGGAITPATPQTVTYGSDLAFAIAPDTGYHIVDVLVDGGSVGAVSAYTFTHIIADHTLAATFARNAYTLTVGVLGQGTVTRTPSQTTYLYGDVVTLTATPAAGWYFGQWNGDASGIFTQTTVTMDAHRLVTATFLAVPPTYTTLTMGIVGSGVVTPAIGAHSYLSGSVVALSATPADGWQFDGWTGDLVSMVSPTTLAMDADKAITATFTPEAVMMYTLTVSLVGQGTVTPTGGIYTAGTVITLTATPAPGWYFGQWNGDASGILTQTTVTMDANRLVTATFLTTPPTYTTLTMHLVGSGVITPDVGVHSYLSGTVVDLSATPATNWQFDGWTGDLESSANPAQLTLNADKAVTATFTLTPVSYTLTIATAGNGRGMVTPGVGAHQYLSGTTMVVTATAQADSDFAGWSGVCSGASPTCAVTLNADKRLTATFTLKTENAAPSANAGADLQVEPGAAVTLDGSSSGDPDGNFPLTYFWQQTGGPAVNFTPTVSRTMFSAPETPTVLTFTLTVTDSLGLADPTPDTVVITVEPYTIYLPFVLRHQ